MYKRPIIYNMYSRGLPYIYKSSVVAAGRLGGAEKRRPGVKVDILKVRYVIIIHPFSVLLL
jgi:hypothetical protein